MEKFKMLFNIKENNVYCDKIFFNNKIIKDFLLNK